MRLLWSLPKAAPAILRHLVAYAELAAQDIEQTQRDLKSRLVASLILIASVVFLMMSGVLAVVALTWDTTYRVAAIAWMGGAFLVIAIAAGLYRSQVVGSRSPFLGSVRREWAEDRVILERILSEHDST